MALPQGGPAFGVVVVGMQRFCWRVRDVVLKSPKVFKDLGHSHSTPFVYCLNHRQDEKALVVSERFSSALGKEFSPAWEFWRDDDDDDDDDDDGRGGKGREKGGARAVTK